MLEVLENGSVFTCVEMNLDCGTDIYDDSDYCGCDVVAEPDTDDDDTCTDWSPAGCGCDYDDYDPAPGDCGCDD